MYLNGLLPLMHTSIPCPFYKLKNEMKGTLSNLTKGMGLVCSGHGIRTQQSESGILHIPTKLSTCIYYMTDARPP